MSNILPINLEDLIYCSGVESSRIEFKASWDPKTTGYQVLRTICAFANDYQNLNGGYILLGVEEENGCAKIPPRGLRSEDIDGIQKWVRGNCKRMDPEYQPIMSPETFMDKMIMVIWAPGSETRPHRVPAGEKREKKYYIRIGSESIDAEKNGFLTGLMQLTAKVPFDDHRRLDARVEDLREGKVREYLHDIRSGLINESKIGDIYRKLKIASPVNGYDVPRNVGLMFFSDDSDAWFPGSRIEVVHFPGDRSGNVLEEKTFRGGVHEQIKAAQNYLEGISSYHLEKQKTESRVKGWLSYPVPALHEALVNACYHRSYEYPPEPVKVYLYPDRIEIISYPGPVPGIELEHLKPNASTPPVPQRNKRVGEFLQTLHLAEARGTGLPKIYDSMRENGSPTPQFDFDKDRTYFRATLPAHPEYIAISALRDAAYMRAIGNEWDAVKRIETSWAQMKGSPTLAAELIRLYMKEDQIQKAQLVFEKFIEEGSGDFVPFVTNVFAETLFNAHRSDKARKLLDQLPVYISGNDALDAAIMARRMKDQKKAHRFFKQAGDAIYHDPRALLEFAQAKIRLNKSSRNPRLIGEALKLLERLVQMDTSPIRLAWAWRELARVKNWLKYPTSEVLEAYEKAIQLSDGEQRFVDELHRFKMKNSIE